MNQIRWIAPPEDLAAVATVLSSWGALVLTDEGEIFVDDLALLSGWAKTSGRPAHMLDLDFASNATEGLDHFAGLRLLPDETFVPSSVTGPLVRLVLEFAQAAGATSQRNKSVVLEHGLQLEGCLEDELSRIQDMKEVMTKVAVGRDEDFAGSASYMGSKRELLPFLLGTIEYWAPDTRTFVDLMAGSGVVAGRATTLWNTVASDAQSFSRHLARAQSGGMTTGRASELMREIRADFTSHDAALRKVVESLLKREKELLHSPLPTEQLAREYSEFVEATPRYPDSHADGRWDPVTEVLARRRGPLNRSPYCLMTAYYSNVYVGVEQAVQIDSLRFAIDQLEHEQDRSFAMAALIIAVSQVASTYGGHFAQPWATPKRVATETGFLKAMRRRTRSVLHEFEARLHALASRSSTVDRSLNIVDGPWREAMQEINRSGVEGPATVYIDAPYKRDEYSRYYHVLETLVTYQYPELPAGDLLPARGVTNGRFASEFSTRSSMKLADALAEVISAALGSGWRVAWSYSNDADSTIFEVLSRVAAPVATCTALSAPHRYRRQGRASTNRDIREYLVLIEPANLPD